MPPSVPVWAAWVGPLPQPQAQGNVRTKARYFGSRKGPRRFLRRRGFFSTRAPDDEGKVAGEVHRYSLTSFVPPAAMEAPGTASQYTAGFSFNCWR